MYIKQEQKRSNNDIDQLNLRCRAPMSIREAETTQLLPLIVTSSLKLNATGRYKSSRLGISTLHFLVDETHFQGQYDAGNRTADFLHP